MRRFMFLLGLLVGGVPASAADSLPNPILAGLKNPAAAVVDDDGRIYVAEIGASGRAGDGRILVNKKGKTIPFATGLDAPGGMVFWRKRLFVVDNQRIWRIDEKGKAVVAVAPEAFPSVPISLHDIAVDENGVLYVTDAGDLKEHGGSVYRIDLNGKVSVVADARKTPRLKAPHGVVLDGVSHLLLVDFATGELLRISISDGSASKVAEGFDGGDGLTWDSFGQLFISSSTKGKVWGIARPGQKAVVIASGFELAALPCLGPDGKSLLVPDRKAGTVTALPTIVPGNEVDDRPVPLQAVPAFPHLKWAGWEGVTEKGKPVELRPVFLTHAGDGSQRNFVTIQQGIIHVFPNDPDAQKTKIFLDIRKKVFYSDDQNEQGLLGLAFHPNFRKNREFFVFYTVREPKLTNVLSRFRASKDDPDKADPDSEEELLRISHSFWNHDGGTIAFGPDGFLYLVLGDGGSANDPHKNGQNLKTLLAKIIRIDIDHREGGKRYGIPADNPFVGVKDAAPEIWAYGLRNPWRMAFDRETGRLWAADVGQNLYEEIDHIVKGGNYGWSVREGLHPFGVDGVGPRKDLIEPIWEYRHDIGKSITGGLVYRGKRLPELQGHYIYGDYITGRIWALKYDDVKKRVVANRPLRKTKQSIFSFAEDERGEIYFLVPSYTGQGIYRFEAITTKSD